VHIVALDVGPHAAEDRASVLAEAMGKTRAEVAPRLRVPGGGPTIIATYADVDMAQALKDRLDAAGLHGILLRERDIEARAPGHRSVRFELTKHHLRTFTREGSGHELAYRDVSMLLQISDNRTQLGRPSAGPAIMRDLGIADPLVIARLHGRTPASGEYARSTNFQSLRVYVGSRPVLQLRGLDLSFEGLGTELLRTRTANFQRFTDLLRDRCPHAAHDDRLASRTRVSQILGPALSPDQHLHVATTLIARVIGPAANPFRAEG
jgi:hypothetical protein